VKKLVHKDKLKTEVRFFTAFAEVTGCSFLIEIQTHQVGLH
jgi:hypothetical protein